MCCKFVKKITVILKGSVKRKKNKQCCIGQQFLEGNLEFTAREGRSKKRNPSIWRSYWVDEEWLSQVWRKGARKIKIIQNINLKIEKSESFFKRKNPSAGSRNKKTKLGSRKILRSTHWRSKHVQRGNWKNEIFNCEKRQITISIGLIKLRKKLQEQHSHESNSRVQPSWPDLAVVNKYRSKVTGNQITFTKTWIMVSIYRAGQGVCR